MKVNAINYRQNKPIVYNKGTKYERTCDTFLAIFFPGTITEAVAYADRLNAEKPESLFNGDSAKCEERTYFAEETEI